MKKAQITIFIVLGIVIMIIFGLMFLVSRQTSGVFLEKKVNKIYEDFLRSTDIRRITDNCLGKTTGEALLLVGLQGGRIYDYQIRGGYKIDSFYNVIPFNYTDTNPAGKIYNVSYGIKAPIVQRKLGRQYPPYPNPPDYPYPDSLIENPTLQFDPSHTYSESFYAHLFSFQNKSLRVENRPLLVALCNKMGVNLYNITLAQITCETYSSKNESVQEYIKQYIEQNIRDCINFTLKKTPTYTVYGGNLSVQVLIGEDDLLVSLVYPIEISIKNKPPITKYLNFNIRPKIRLKTLHEIASHLIGKYPLNYPAADADNIFFDITKDDPNDCYNKSVPCVIEGIKVYKLEDYCLKHSHCNFDNRHYNYSDIVVIEDSKSIIDGRSYRFQFVIENRRPALDFIDENVGSDKYYYWYINATYGKNLTEVYSNITGHPVSHEYNIIVKSPAILEIFPLGIDPDEDNLTYRYSVIDSPLGWTESTFEDISLYYKFGVDYKKDVSGFVSDHKIAKDSSVEIAGVTSADNIIRINVSDSEGLYDYQDIAIRVVGNPP